MATAAAKTVVATGLTSGLGLEALKQLLQAPQPYRVVLGARNTGNTEKAISDFKYDAAANPVTILPLELSNLKDVKRFAGETLEKIGQNKIDLLFLNAGMSNSAEKEGPYGSKWCESLIVNHYSQYYLIHLLREKLVQDRARIVFVSSGAVRNVPDTSVMDKDLRGASGAEIMKVYCQSKFVQLLGAQWWRRQLAGTNDVVAVSPGLIPGTGLGRHYPNGAGIPKDHPDAKDIPTGARSMLDAATREDLPEDPERMFLTSWGEWWEKDVYKQALDKELQDKWCPSKEQLEKDEGITA